jgi:hypothetical protein
MMNFDILRASVKKRDIWFQINTQPNFTLKSPVLLPATSSIPDVAVDTLCINPFLNCFKFYLTCFVNEKFVRLCAGILAGEEYQGISVFENEAPHFVGEDMRVGGVAKLYYPGMNLCVGGESIVGYFSLLSPYPLFLFFINNL